MDEEERERHDANKEMVQAQRKEEQRRKRRERYAANREKEIQQVLEYKAIHRDKINAIGRKYHAEHRDEVNKKRREYSALHREELNAKQRAYNAAHRDEIREKRKGYARVRGRKEKLETLQRYSSDVPSCVCCGETIIEFLCIDHINGNGNKHRKEIGLERGQKMYHWLKKNNYPDGFQVLCCNCNTAKGLYGQCPHQLK